MKLHHNTEVHGLLLILMSNKFHCMKKAYALSFLTSFHNYFCIWMGKERKYYKNNWIFIYIIFTYEHHIQYYFIIMTHIYYKMWQTFYSQLVLCTKETPILKLTAWFSSHVSFLLCKYVEVLHECLQLINIQIQNSLLK